MKQGGEGQVREEEEGDGAPAWGSPARVVACEDLAGEEGSRSSGSYLLDEGKDRARGPLLSCCTHGNEEARGSVVGAGTDAEEVTGEAGEDDGSCCLRTQRPWLSPVSENREREGKIVRTGGRVASGEKEQGCRGTHLRRLGAAAPAALVGWATGSRGGTSWLGVEIEEERGRLWLKSRRGGFGSGKIPRWKERPGGVAAR